MKLEFSELIILIIAGIVVLLIGSGFLYWKDKLEILPTFFVAEVAAGFSYLAYYNAREKFRLDLFDKRYECYKACLMFCSLVVKHGGFPDTDGKFSSDRYELEKAARQSINSEGWHKSKFFFGSDIDELYKELDKVYNFFNSYSEQTKFGNYPEGYSKAVDEKTKHLLFMNKTIGELPDLFSRYLNFSKH